MTDAGVFSVARDIWDHPVLDEEIPYFWSPDNDRDTQAWIAWLNTQVPDSLRKYRRRSRKKAKSGRCRTLRWARIRKRIFARDNYTCRYCGMHGGPLECDHIIPVTRGGGDSDDNLVTACLPCNRSKGNRTIAEWKGAA